MSDSGSSTFPISVRLRRGRDPRKVRVGIYSSMDEPDRIAPTRVLDAFAAGVEAGLFGRATIADPALGVKLMPEHRIVADILTGTLSWMSPPSFGVLLDMVKLSVPGIAGLEILEDHPNERVLIVRTIEPEAEATILDVDWRISFNAAGDAGVAARFLEPPAPPTLGRATRLLRAWAELITLGAYPAPDLRPSAARLLEVTARDELDLLARFDRIACGYSAFEALFAAFDRLHEDAPLQSLEVACGRR